MARKARVPTSQDVKANAEKTYRKFLPQTMLRSLGIGGKPTYFYVYGFTEGGKQMFWGPMPREQAEAAGCGLIEGEVFELETRDLKKATQAIKAELLKRGIDPDKALSRMSHIQPDSFIKCIKKVLS